jgi:hypothetical protein
VADEYELLPDRTLHEIAARCGRGFGRAGDKVPVSMTLFGQRSRIENYRVVVSMASVHLRRGEHIDDFRDRIWQHVCHEVDLWCAARKAK